MTALHMAATINDVHVVDFILNSVEDPNRAVNVATNEGWTPSHFAGFLNNFDSQQALHTLQHILLLERNTFKTQIFSQNTFGNK